MLNLFSNRRVFLGLCLSVLQHADAAVAIVPSQGVNVTTRAEYRGIVDGPQTLIAGNPGSVDINSSAGPGGGGIGSLSVAPQNSVDTFDAAIARGRASLPGTIGSYSHAGGFSPSFGTGTGPVTASADTSSLTRWMATSTDPNITSVAIDVLVFFDGTLLTADFAGAGPGQLFSSVNTRLSSFSANGGLYDLNLSAQLDSAGGLTADSGWSGDFEFGSSQSGNVNQATLNYNQFFNDAFVVNIGEAFSWEVVLNTNAYAEGPFELWAIADFFNTGGFALSVNTPGITLAQVPVPLPLSLPLFGAGLLMMVYKRMAVSLVNFNSHPCDIKNLHIVWNYT